MIDLSPIWLTLQLAFITTFLLFFISLPIAYWLALSKWKIKSGVEALVSMPLVLPPTVIGFYFLVALSPNNEFGSFIQDVLGFKLLFSFGGLVIASIIYSLPFMVNPISSGISSLDKSLIEASTVLGKNRFSTFWNVILPNIKPSILSALVLSFAHTIGEFGVVLMIGGNIPDRTRVASIAIYDRVEAMDYSSANIYSMILFSFSFIILLLLYINKNRINKGGLI